MAIISAVTACGEMTSGGQYPDKLVVGTMYSPTGFFIVRGDTLGYDYDRICDFAHSKGLPIEFKVAHSLNELVAMLNNGQVDILATEVPNSGEYRRQVINCGSINETRPVLVQNTGKEHINSVTQLAGRDVYVQAGSKYEELVNNMNSEMGGLIKVHPMHADSVSTDELLNMVSTGKIDYTIVDSDIAQFNAAHYDSIDVTVKMGIPQTSSWAVSLDNKWLADSIDAWSNSTNARAYSKQALERYFNKNQAKDEVSLVNEIPHLGGGPGTGTSGAWGTRPGPTVHSWGPVGGGTSGNASSFTALFQRYAPATGWDWKLLAAIARVESNYNCNAVSWAGARGLMQVMPSTARGHGVDPDQLFDPEVAVRVAAQCIQSLNKQFTSRIPNREQRLRFIVASYNAGAGHVLDAMALAQKYGKNPLVWEGNVEEAMLWESMPQYYNDPVCKYGYCRGRETVDYVIKVKRHYGIW